MNRYNSTERVRFSVEQRALAQQPQEQKEYVRRSQGRQPAERKAALVIMGAAVACVLIVACAIWHTGRSTGSAADPAVHLEVSRNNDSFAVQAGGFTNAPASTPLPGQDYQQLSDPLLVLVNDQVPLPQDWEVTPNFIGDEIVDIRAYSQLDAMFLAAEQDGVSFWVCSGYRSVEDQEDILAREIRLHMQNDGMSQEEAQELSLRTIARPGYSEHHTGLAVDLNDVSDNFEETEAYRWLQAHSADYGFVQRYRQDKVDITGIDNESWHYRYVGVEHAQEMNRLDLCLEEYVEYLKEQGVR